MSENQPVAKALPKRRFKITKQGVLTFLSGMLLALLLGVGIQAAVNPSFMEGTTSAASQVTRYQMFPAKGILPQIEEAQEYCGEIIPIYIPAGNGVSAKYGYTPYNGQSLKITTNTALYAALNGGTGEDSTHTNFYLPNYNKTPLASNITCFFPTAGAFPYPFGSAEKTAGGIAYVVAPFPQKNEYGQYGYVPAVGEVLLLKTNDRELLSNDYLPCEGQLLKLKDYPIFANTAAAEQTVFRIPDLSDQTPIDGAEFYICFNGIYVYAK